MANRIRLGEGVYTADREAAVYLMHHTREVSYSLVKAGEDIVVPRHVNGFWRAVKYWPEFGDERPVIERRATCSG